MITDSEHNDFAWPNKENFDFSLTKQNKVLWKPKLSKQ